MATISLHAVQSCVWKCLQFLRVCIIRKSTVAAGIFMLAGPMHTRVCTSASKHWALDFNVSAWLQQCSGRVPAELRRVGSKWHAHCTVTCTVHSAQCTLGGLVQSDMHTTCPPLLHVPSMYQINSLSCLEKFIISLLFFFTRTGSHSDFERK